MKGIVSWQAPIITYRFSLNWEIFHFHLKRDNYHVKIVEDAAQGVKSSYYGKALGSNGEFGANSFHETKIFISSEGGAILVNDQNLTLQAEIIRDERNLSTNFTQPVKPTRDFSARTTSFFSNWTTFWKSTIAHGCYWLIIR